MTDATRGRRATIDPMAVARLRVAVGRLNRRLNQRSAGLLAFAQLSALVTIKERGRIRLGELAQVEGVAPSMSRTLAGLIADGVVAKEPDPQDGRSCYLSVTERGDELMEQVKLHRATELDERVSRLTADEYETLIRAVPVLERLVDDEADGDPTRERRQPARSQR
jgi:DNA-binding MarR family transcriptional regulator